MQERPTHKSAKIISKINSLEKKPHPAAQKTLFLVLEMFPYKEEYLQHFKLHFNMMPTHSFLILVTFLN